MKWHYTANNDFPNEHYDLLGEFLCIADKSPDCLLLDYFPSDGEWQDGASGHVYEHYEVKKWISLREVLDNIEE